MKLETIKKSMASLPHVKTVWVEGNNVYIHEKKGAEKIDLTATQPSEPAAPIEPIEPIEPTQPSEPAEKEDAKSTNKKK
jgi:hypothetical protein